MTPVLLDPIGDDLESLATLHRGAFDDPWSAAAIGTLLAGLGTFAYHAPDGFIVARVAGDEAEILTLAVAPGARRRGLGRDLLAAAARRATAQGAKAMFLEVGVGNAAALALYAGAGFLRVGQRKSYYNGQDAMILRAELPLPVRPDFA